MFIPEHPSPGVGSLEEKSINGERGSGEKKREGNNDAIDELRTNKGSRKTASLLNLFIPLSQGMSMFKPKDHVLHFSTSFSSIISTVEEMKKAV